MSATVKTIKNFTTGNTIYPITKADAVYMTNSTKTVATVINDDLVHTAGDSMTGVLQTIRRIDSIDQNVEDSYTPATTDYYGNSETGAGFYIRDNNKESMGFLAPVYVPSLGAGIQFGAHRKVNNDDIYNSVWFTVKDDGTNYISIDKNAWLSALELTGSSPIVKRKYYSHASGSMSAGSTKTFSASDFGRTDISGYSTLSFYNFTTGNANLVPYVINPSATDSTTMVALKNVGSAAASGTIGIGVIFIKTSFITNA